MGILGSRQCQHEGFAVRWAVPGCWFHPLTPNYPIHHFLFVYLFFYWAVPSSALHLEIASGGAQEIIWNAKNQTWVGQMQGKYPTSYAIIFAPSLHL